MAHTLADMPVRFENVSTESNDKTNNIWKPAYGEEYYALYSDGEVTRSTNFEQREKDLGRLEIGNCFRTREEAEFMAERLKVLEEIRILANGFNPAKGNGWFCLVYDIDTDKMTVDGMYNHSIFPTTCFASYHKAQSAIEKIGKERLKKYYFCIKDQEE